MRAFYQYTTLLGTVKEINTEDHAFTVHCRSGDEFRAFVTDQTWFRPLSNLDGVTRDRYQNPPNFDNSVRARLDKYLTENAYVVLIGVFTQDGDAKRFDARTLYLLYELDGDLFTSTDMCEFVFETSSWWPNQMRTLGDTWLNALFGEARQYDFSKYRTELGITYSKEANHTQEMATLSRLIYGLSSAYLLSGNQRFLDAARSGVEYQREYFRTHDGNLFFWAFGKRGQELIYTSEFPDDKDSLPLYEQIYALAGLAQYYRITLEWEVLEDIERTVTTMVEYFKDHSEYGGFYSHLDLITRTPNSEFLGQNASRKNWNSVGDHIPAYLVNLILALEPLPENASKLLTEFLRTSKSILKETSRLIIEKFPEERDGRWRPYVFERFHEDWTPDLTWGWQQNRAVVGHNLKIAWNMTRVAFYYMTHPDPEVDVRKMIDLAEHLANSMVETGAVDLFRGGCFDAVEREPKHGLPIEFTWLNTKDFWQQEQGVLAYFILYGCTKKPHYLALAREMATFWNVFCLDRDTRGVFFRTTDGGSPVIEGDYGDKGTHSISGYHAFELNFLAHIYVMTYVKRERFRMYFKPVCDCRRNTINVLPDFVPPGVLRITEVVVNGQKLAQGRFDPNVAQIAFDTDHGTTEIEVEFEPVAEKLDAVAIQQYAPGQEPEEQRELVHA